jgi:phage-related minor tail protein
VSELLDGWAAAKGIWALFISGAGVIAVRQMNRIDKLEEASVPKADHERALDRMREDHQRNIDRVEKSLSDLRIETQTGFNRIFTRLDEIADRIK